MNRRSPQSDSQGPPCPRLAVIGCGAAANEFYLPVLRSIAGSAESVILVDPLDEQRQAVANKFGFRNMVSDYRDLTDDIQGVLIATPHHLHAEQAKHFLERGCHVFVEKPLALNAEELGSLMDAARQSPSVLMVNNYRRLFPSYRYVRELLGEQQMGRVRSISIHDGTEFGWNSATSFYLRDPRVRGVLLDRGAHTVDVVHWWLDRPLTVVGAKSDAPNFIEGRFDLQLRGGDTMVELKFSRFDRLSNTFTILCDHGKIEGRLFDFSRLRLTRHGKSQQIVAGPSKPHQDFAWELAHNFVRVVQGVETPQFTAEDVAPSIITLSDAYDRAQPMEMSWFQDDPNLAYLRDSAPVGHGCEEEG